MARLIELECIEGSPDYMFDCLGCECSHGIWTKRKTHPKWEFNGSLDKPTFSPSILVRFGPNGKFVCHSFVRNGMIQYLNDCTHKLAGKTIELPEIDN